jgi:alpha-tubulin suppressor-like RCC1 family protein
MIIPNLPKMIDVACGEYHSLALDEEEYVWSWDGATMPERVPGLKNIVEITCHGKTSDALDDQDTLFVWSRDNSAIKKIDKLPGCGPHSLGSQSIIKRMIKSANSYG